MANPWFRFYAEFSTDPKVQFMSEPLQRRYVFALCVTCSGEIEKLTDDEMAYAMRITAEEWAETKKVFIDRGLFTLEGKVKNWDKRQFKADTKDPTNADRQKRHRDKKRYSTVTEPLLKPLRNGSNGGVTESNGGVTGGVTGQDFNDFGLSEQSQGVTQPLRNGGVTEKKRPDTDSDNKNKGTKFVPPTFDEVSAYCVERGKGVNPNKWYNHYTANDWKVGKNKMKDWRAAIRTWEPDEPTASTRQRRFEL